MFVFRTCHFNRFIFTLIFWNTHATFNSKFPTAINLLTAINLFIVWQKPTFISCISIITNTFVLLYAARSIALLRSQQNGSWNGPWAMDHSLWLNRWRLLTSRLVWCPVFWYCTFNTHLGPLALILSAEVTFRPMLILWTNISSFESIWWCVSE